MRNFTRAIFVVMACLAFVVPVSFALAASSRAASGSPAFSICPAPGTGHWPMFGYNVAGTRDNTAEKMLKTSNVGSLVEDWSYTTGDFVQSSPAIENGVLYIGSNDGYLYALNASTGALIWSYYSGYGGIISSPAVVNGVVYVGAAHISKNVFALNAGNGALIWSYALSTAVDGSPTVASGVVYIMDNNGKEYALKAKNGALLWSFSTGQGNYTDHSQAVVNGVVYFGDNDDKLYALNASTGALLWSYSTGSAVAAAPAVANGVVYIASNDFKLYALNASTGALLWTYTTGSYIQPAPAVANGVVYIGSNDDKLYALNASTGALLWSYTAASYVLNSPLVANGVIYDASYGDDKLFALNAKNGKLLWSYAVGGPYLDNSPAVANGMLYIGANDHKVYAFSLPAVMQVSPTSLNFSGQAGGPNPPDQTLTLTNTGGSTISWSGCASQSWLGISPASGSLNAGTNTGLTISVNTIGLAAGTYNDTIVIAPSVGPAESVPVTLTLS